MHTYIDEIRSDRQMSHTEKRMLEPIYGLKSIFSFQETNNYKKLNSCSKLKFKLREQSTLNVPNK